MLTSSLLLMEEIRLAPVEVGSLSQEVSRISEPSTVVTTVTNSFSECCFRRMLVSSELPSGTPGQLVQAAAS